jgi:hypothetical protein
MKKLFLALLMFFAFNTNAFAGNTSDLLYYVTDFYTNSDNVKSTISQSVTKASLACGPTSLLFVNSHFLVKKTGVKPIFTETVANAITELKGLYKYIGYPYNSATDLDRLNTIAKGKLGLLNSRRMDASSGVNFNVGELIRFLKADYPALVVLKSTFPANPTAGTHNIDHIVMVYAYQKRQDRFGNVANSPINDRQNDRIYFYDPYYGGNGYFTRGEIPTAVSLTGFAFLKLAP